MMSCAPGTGVEDGGHPTVPPSKTKPCGAKIMPVTFCKEKIMEKEVRDGSGWEEDDGKVGADGERGLPMDPRITTPPTSEKVEGPQERGHEVTLGCDKRAAGHSFDERAGSQKRGTPHGGRAWQEASPRSPK